MGQDIPKQFMPIDNKPVIVYTMQVFQYHPEIDAIAVVCLSGWDVMLQAYANQYNISKLKWIFDGGDTNQESIYNGITGLKESGASDDDIIIVHDGVRPLIDQRIISDNISTCRQFGYAVTGLVCKEVVMELDGGKLRGIGIPRERLVLTQTPHTYRLGTLMKAHRTAGEKGIGNTVASCSLVDAIGLADQHLVEGSEKNGLKLTRPQDVEIFKAMIHSHPEAWMK